MSKMEWNDEQYLRANPDVAQAVQARGFKSGLDHFLNYGKYESRPGVPVADWIQPTSPGLHAEGPWPPEHLRLRVHGDRALESYVLVGKMVAQDLEWALDHDAARLPPDARVLDFGCGPGRVMTWFHSLHRGWRFTGTDIDAEAIGWAAGNLSHIGSFDVNAPHPPLKYPDAHFDFIFSISIFTHLPEDMEIEWLRELGRVARPGALLALSVHSEDLLTRSMPKRGFHYAVGDGTDGLPEFYQTSFHTNAYIEREWSKIFRVERILKKHITNHQDLVICRKA
jgi:SAM-dependent methyltransferase